MATATGTNVKFVKVQTKQQYTDYTAKDGALIFVENERKIYVDGVAYGFSDSDVEGKFLELTGGKMSGNILMDGNSISSASEIIFQNGGGISQEGDGLEFYSFGDLVLTLGFDDNHDSNIHFSSLSITGIPEPAEGSSPISEDYLNATVVNRIGVAYGIASLDYSGKVPSEQLPSYVDDVIEYSAKASFPATGETGKLYIDLSNNKVWRWGGSAYVNVSDGNAHLVLGETQSTAYRGDRGKTAYDHSQLAGTNDNPHSITKGNVGLSNVQNYLTASKTQAEDGTSDGYYMTPLRVKQAVEKLSPKLSWEVVA